MTRLLSAAARRLTDTLGELKARVREAIAGVNAKLLPGALKNPVRLIQIFPPWLARCCAAR